jgi:hypothetical protein
MLALAEAKLGTPGAAERLDATIAQQLLGGVTGLRLGLSYEARAQVALWTGDESGFQHYARLTAREYRYGAQSSLGVRYDRLINEATRNGLHVDTALTDFEPETAIDNSALGDDVRSAVMRSMVGAVRAEQRAEAALELICDMRSSSVGHLYLSSGDTFALGASRGEAAPERLALLAREYLEEERSCSQSMTAMMPENLPDDTSARIGDTHYQLLLLSCVIGGVGQVAGVAAVATGESAVRNVKQEQLLTALAMHLVATSNAAYSGP